MQEPKFELVVIGSGAGASYIYDGLTSSSVMLLCNGEPFCLIDLGLGVGRKVMECYGMFPEKIIITHNHSDHAGDLAVVLRVEQAKGSKCQVLAAEPVMQRLQQHRIAEHLQQMSADELADWTGLLSQQTADIGHGLSIEFFPGIHSELSYGFVISDQLNQPRLSYTGDSQFAVELYQPLSKANVFIIDARPKPNQWHAHFSEINGWLTPSSYILGHGLTPQQAQQEYAELPLLLANQTVCF